MKGRQYLGTFCLKTICVTIFMCFFKIPCSDHLHRFKVTLMSDKMQDKMQRHICYCSSSQTKIFTYEQKILP